MIDKEMFPVIENLMYLTIVKIMSLFLLLKKSMKIPFLVVSLYIDKVT